MNSHTYNSPFLKFKAEIFKHEEVRDLWAKPIVSEQLENEMFGRPEVIFISGARGSGKTMIQRYYSYNVQKLNVNDLTEVNLGLFLLYDLITMSTFQSDNKTHQAELNRIFNLYHNASLTKGLFDIIRDYREHGLVDNDDINALINLIAQSFPKLNINNSDSLFMFPKYIVDNISTYFRSNTAAKRSFEDDFSLLDCNIFIEMLRMARATLPALKGKTIYILLDEIENFNLDQQLMIYSNIASWVPENVYFRISSRPKGIKVKALIAEELLKSIHISTINLSTNFDLDSIKKLHQSVVDRFLETHEWFKNNPNCTIHNFLGEDQDFIEESKHLLESDLVRAFMTDERVTRDFTSLVETLTNYRSEYEKSTMLPEDKFGIYLMLSRIARRKRMYYGLNTLSQMSGSNIRYFLNACDRMFRKAAFKDEASLKQGLRINTDIQREAITEEAFAEIENYLRINIYGNDIYNMIMNIGNILEKLQLDYKHPKYGLNQFVLPQHICDQERVTNAIKWGAVIEENDGLSISSAVAPIFGIGIYPSSKYRVAFSEPYENLFGDDVNGVNYSCVESNSNYTAGMFKRR